MSQATLLVMLSLNKDLMKFNYTTVEKTVKLLDGDQYDHLQLFEANNKWTKGRFEK